MRVLLLEQYDASWAVPLVNALEDPEFKPEATTAIEEAIAAGKINDSMRFAIWWALKDADRAADAFYSGERTQDIEMLWAPESTFLREHPRFPELVESVGLTGYQ